VSDKVSSAGDEGVEVGPLPPTTAEGGGTRPGQVHGAGGTQTRRRPRRCAPLFGHPGAGLGNVCLLRPALHLPTGVTSAPSFRFLQS